MDLYSFSIQDSSAVVFHVEGGVAYETDAMACAGALAMFCNKVSEAEGTAGAYYSRHEGEGMETEKSSSAALQFSFEYTTSDDPEKAGKVSDMFLTPSLNIAFAESENVNLDMAKCRFKADSITTWSLQGERNLPVRAKPWFAFR
jgi:hypothetical protein